MASFWYLPPTQNINVYFDNVGHALDFYTQKYDKILLADDFNATMSINIRFPNIIAYELTVDRFLYCYL